MQPELVVSAARRCGWLVRTARQWWMTALSSGRSYCPIARRRGGHGAEGDPLGVFDPQDAANTPASCDRCPLGLPARPSPPRKHEDRRYGCRSSCRVRRVLLRGSDDRIGATGSSWPDSALTFLSSWRTARLASTASITAISSMKSPCLTHCRCTSRSAPRAASSISPPFLRSSSRSRFGSNAHGLSPQRFSGPRPAPSVGWALRRRVRTI